MTTLTSSPAEVLPPPSERYTLLGWLRKNLFSSWLNSILTLLSLVAIYFALRSSLRWSLTGAEWAVISANLRLFLIGQYPIEQAWRIWLGAQLVVLICGLSWGIWGRSFSRWTGLIVLAVPVALALLPLEGSTRFNLLLFSVLALVGWVPGRLWDERFKRVAVIGWVVIFPIFIILVRGLTPAGGFMPVVPPNLWGGLLLTFMLTVIGITFSFPLGVLLALGRRGQLPVVRWISIAFIELVRGVPLVTVLFMSTFMLPLFMPGNLNPDRVLRAMVGITLFSAAYLAENVRGGLQSIPHGQYEAADALGLSGVQSMVLIILPQALRAVIPVLVGQFISLFKDTSLVAIVGLFDLLGIADTVLAQPDFIGLQIEVYLFISLLYFVFSYIMSFLSQRLEKNLGVGER